MSSVDVTENIFSDVGWIFFTKISVPDDLYNLSETDILFTKTHIILSYVNYFLIFISLRKEEYGHYPAFCRRLS